MNPKRSGQASLEKYGEAFLKSGEWWCPICFAEVAPGHFTTFPDHHMNWTPTKDIMLSDPKTVHCQNCGTRIGEPCIQRRWGEQSFCLRRFYAAYLLTHPHMKPTVNDDREPGTGIEMRASSAEKVVAQEQPNEQNGGQ